MGGHHVTFSDFKFFVVVLVEGVYFSNGAALLGLVLLLLISYFLSTYAIHS